MRDIVIFIDEKYKNIAYKSKARAMLKKLAPGVGHKQPYWLYDAAARQIGYVYIYDSARLNGVMDVVELVKEVRENLGVRYFAVEGTDAPTRIKLMQVFKQYFISGAELMLHLYFQENEQDLYDKKVVLALDGYVSILEDESFFDRFKDVTVLTQNRAGMQGYLEEVYRTTGTAAYITDKDIVLKQADIVLNASKDKAVAKKTKYGADILDICGQAEFTRHANVILPQRFLDMTQMRMDAVGIKDLIAGPSFVQGVLKAAHKAYDDHKEEFKILV